MRSIFPVIYFLVSFLLNCLPTVSARELNSLPGGGTKSGSFPPDTTVTLVYRDTLEIESDEDFDLPVTMQGDYRISAISLGFIFPREYLDITGMKLADETPGFTYNLTDSLFSMAWSSVNSLDISDGEAVVTLQMKSYDLSGLQGVIKLGLDGMSEFADDSASIIDNVVLLIPVIRRPDTTAMDRFVKVYPNPFIDEAVVEFYLESESSVKLSICNSAGQLVHQMAERTYPEGLSEERIPVLCLSKGIYFLKFEASSETESSKEWIKVISIR